MIKISKSTILGALLLTIPAFSADMVFEQKENILLKGKIATVKTSKKYRNIEILWASTREAYNFLQAKDLGCQIITTPPKIIDKINLPQKVWNDCQQCLHQDNCDETAMSFSLIRDENLLFTGSTNTPEKVVPLPTQIKPPLGNPEQVLYSS